MVRRASLSVTIIPLTRIELTEDAAAWGYHPLNSRTSFEPNFDSRIPPFQLLLVGAGGIEIPAELAFVATVHHDLAYKDFYKLVASADIVVPAFAQFGCECLSICLQTQAVPSAPSNVLRGAVIPWGEHAPLMLRGNRTIDRY